MIPFSLYLRAGIVGLVVILNDGSAETILRTLVEVSRLYYECQSRQASLAAAVQPLSPAGGSVDSR